MKLKLSKTLLLRHLTGIEPSALTLSKPIDLNKVSFAVRNTDYPQERPLGKHCLDRHQLEVLLWESSKENEQLREKVKRLDWWP